MDEDVDRTCWSEIRASEPGYTCYDEVLLLSISWFLGVRRSFMERVELNREFRCSICLDRYETHAQLENLGKLGSDAICG